MRVLAVTVDQDVCGDSLPAQDLIIRNGKVVNAVVWVEGAQGEVGEREYRLFNTGCHFEPPVLAATMGGILIVENTDPILHNIHFGLRFDGRKRTVGNLALPKAGMTIRAPRALRRPGLIEITCDAHSWMSARMWVFEHPYFAVTGDDGSFEIRGLPPGTYTLRVWHDVLGEQERQVTVKPGETSSEDFAYTGA